MEMFAPVAKFTSIWTLLAPATWLDLEVYQLDVKSAYLNADFEKEIYMCCPLGYPSGPNVIWCLKKSLYGLKQAGREWYKNIHKEYKSQEFTQSEADHSVFYKFTDREFIFIAIYIDNMLSVTNSSALCSKHKAKLQESYEIMDLGEAHWILNIEVTQ